MQKAPLLSPTLRWFLAGMVLANIAGEMFYSLLPLYLADLGTSIDNIGLVFSLASVAMLFLQLFGGWVSDTIGRLRAIAIGSGVATLGYFLMVLANAWPAALVAICLEYVSMGLVGTSFAAFIAEESPEATRGRVFGLSTSIFMVVTVIGPPLAGLLTARFGFKPMLLAAALLYATASGLRIWMSLTARTSVQKVPERLSFGKFRIHLSGMVALVTAGGVLTWLLITDGVRDVSGQLSNNLLPLFLKDIGGLDVQQIGLLIAIYGLASMPAMFLGGWIADHWNERTAIAGGYVLMAAGMAIFLAVGGFLGYGAAVAVIGLGTGMMDPAYNALITKIVPENMRGMAFGLFRSSIGVFSLAAPWLGARLWTAFNPRLPFALTAAALLIIILPVWIKFRRPEKPASPAEIQL
jgi:MFS family permease